MFLNHKKYYEGGSNMKRKLISIALVGALVVSMGAMAGCGSEEAKEENAAASEAAVAEEQAVEAEQAEEASEAESAAEEVAETASSGGDTLTLYAWDPSFNIPAMEAAGEDYKEKVDPDFNLNIVEQANSGDIETLLTNVASTGESAYDQLPDITLFQDHYFQQYYKNYPDIWVPVEADGVDINWDNFAQEKLSYGLVDGVHYGTPVDSGTCVAAYRTDYLEEAGHTVDELVGCTWDEFIEIGKDVYDATGKYLLCMPSDGNDLVYIMMQEEGASQFKDGEPYIVGNETLERVISIIVEMAQNNVLLLCNSWDDYINNAIQGDQVAGVINGNYILPSIEILEDNAGKWAVETLPTIEGGEGYAANGGSALYITAGCENVDLARDFLAWTFGGESYDDTGESITYDGALENGGVVTTYSPAGDSEVYSEPVAYFGDEPIYKSISEWTALVPTVEQNDAHYSCRSYLDAAIVDIINGADMDSELEQAETQLRFEMGLN